MKTIRKDSAEWQALMEADRAFWRQVVAEMNLKPGIGIPATTPDTLSFNAWGIEPSPRWELRL